MSTQLTPEEQEPLRTGQGFLDEQETSHRLRRKLAKADTCIAWLKVRLEKALRIIVALALSRRKARHERDLLRAELARYQRLHGREDA